MGGEFSTDFKSSKHNWIISISSTVIEFLLIPGVSPLGVVGECIWVGAGVYLDGCWGVYGVSHAHAC